jgi:hypothetical protein
MSQSYPIEKILEMLEEVKIDPSEAVDDDDATWIGQHNEIVDKCIHRLTNPEVYE